MFVLGDAEQGDALGYAAGDADVGHLHANEFGLIRDQHQMLSVAHREAGDDVAIAFGRIDIGDALPAATGAAIFIGARTLAIAVGGHRQDELLVRSEEHTSELQSLMRISYAVFCLHKKTKNK